MHKEGKVTYYYVNKCKYKYSVKTYVIQHMYIDLHTDFMPTINTKYYQNNTNFMPIQ